MRLADDLPVVDTIPPNGKGVVYLGETRDSGYSFNTTVRMVG